MWKILTFSSQLYQKIPLDIAMDQQYPQVLPTGPQLLPGNTAGAWAKAGGLEPSWLRYCSCSVSRTSLQVVEKPARYTVQSQPADPYTVISSVPSATVFVFSVFLLSQL